ncbi:MAG: hypothetical protein IPG32_07525 [Saprospirales bacterium]|nr:hypothetical protein [Saprospirales bacterium]
MSHGIEPINGQWSTQIIQHTGNVHTLSSGLYEQSRINRRLKNGQLPFDAVNILYNAVS